MSFIHETIMYIKHSRKDARMSILDMQRKVKVIEKRDMKWREYVR